MSVLRFDIPGPDAPGFLKRQRRVLEFQQKMENDLRPETLDAMVEFLADFVTEPEDPEAKREALWDATQEQFMQLLQALSGEYEEENPTE